MSRQLFLIVLFASAALAQQTKWVSTWSTAPAPQLTLAADVAAAKMLFSNQTLRQVVHTSIGGKFVRVAVSNVFGQSPLQVDAAHIALRTTGANIVAGSDLPLTFSGQSTITIPTNAVMLSDPLRMDVPQAGDLVISIYLAQTTSGAGIHYSAAATSYIGAGNQVSAVTFNRTTTVGSWAFLASVDVLAPASAAAIVAFGDSITDGTQSTLDANHRWPNLLADRLLAAGVTDRAVIDSGISGNRVLHDSQSTASTTKFGWNALARFERDALAKPGAKYVIILEGINDLGQPGTTSAPISELVSGYDVIAGLQQMADRAHELGFTVIGCTITPFAVYTSAGYYTQAKDDQRAIINQWIRTTSAFDAVVDFDKVIRDPANPQQFLAAYDSGDHLHPNDTGYQAMANAIDLTLFSTPSIRRRP